MLVLDWYHYFAAKMLNAWWKSTKTWHRDSTSFSPISRSRWLRSTKNVAGELKLTGSWQSCLFQDEPKIRKRGLPSSLARKTRISAEFLRPASFHRTSAKNRRWPPTFKYHQQLSRLDRYLETDWGERIFECAKFIRLDSCLPKHIETTQRSV